MKTLPCLLFVLAAFGCAPDEKALWVFPDAGGAAGSAGSAGSVARGVAGNVGAGGNGGGVAGLAGTAGAGGSAGSAGCDGHPDACNTCAAGHLQALPNGTRCGNPPASTICVDHYTDVNGPIEAFRSETQLVCSDGTCGAAAVPCASAVTCTPGQHAACLVDILSNGSARMEGAGCGCYSIPGL